jgi:Transcriptional regulator, AbiEi antitoxin, Type IV TA system
VKKRGVVNIAGPFEPEALRVLRAIPGVTVDLEPGEADRGVDAILRFADQRAPIAVEFKQRANAATAWQLVHDAEHLPGTPLLLIAGETTAEARAILEDRGIAVIDGLGNAHIELPGLMFHMEGRRHRQRSPGPMAPTRLRGKAGVVAQALLVDPNRAWAVQDLAKEADVSAGLAHRVLTRLEGEGLVAVEGTGPSRVRRLTNPTALLDLWTEEQEVRPVRTLGYVLAQTPQQLIAQLAADLDRAGIDYAMTGAAGASLVAPFATAVPVVDVWVTATAAPDELLASVHADPVDEGQNVVFLQAKNDTPLAFREQVRDARVANRFRLYADLRRDPRRGREQADHLREEVIGF